MLSFLIKYIKDCMNTFYHQHHNPIPDDHILIFGSNLAGRHGLGVARIAMIEYGAIYGRGKGLHGRTYGIPTKDSNLKVLPLVDIEDYIGEFVLFTLDNPNLKFYITEVGTGLAGFKHYQIAPMFRGAINCMFSHLWEPHLKGEEMPTALIKTYAKQSGKTIQQAEECWSKSKDAADKKFKEKDEHYWAYVNASTRKCLGINKEK